MQRVDSDLEKYVTIAELQDISSDEEFKEVSMKILRKSVKDDRLNVVASPYIPFEEWNVRPEKFEFDGGQQGADNAGGYYVTVFASYTTDAPVLNDRKEVDLQDPLSTLNVEEVLVSAKCMYATTRDVEDVKGIIQVVEDNPDSSSQRFDIDIS